MECGGEDVMAEEKMTSVEAVFKAVEGAPPDLLRELLEVIVTRVMGADAASPRDAGAVKNYQRSANPWVSILNRHHRTTTPEGMKTMRAIA
jgi:hypothetical protein